MGYKLRPDRRFEDEVRAAAGGELENAIAALVERPKGLHEGIHTARKHVKRVRALYRLIAGQTPDFQRQENTRLRDMVHSLATFRNGEALVEVGRYLQDTATDNSEAAALARVTETLTARRDWLARAETDLEAKTEAAVATCREALAALESVRLSRGRRASADLLKKGWRRTGRRAAEALAKCHMEAHAGQFHELRKRCQDYWMQHALLRELWPSAMLAKLKEARSLVDILGRYHDLTVLSGVVDHERELFSRGDDLATLLEAITSRQESCRREALSVAERVLSDKPAREARTIERLWLQEAA
jgi:hypothetical protein